MAEDNKDEDALPKGVGYYVRLFLKYPLRTISALAAIAVFVFVSGVGTWLSDQGKNVAQWGCEQAGICEAKEAPWSLAFSTAVPNCLTGRIDEKLRDWSPSWEKGAERLVICADATIQGKKSEIPEKLAQRFKACLSIKKTDDSLTVATALDSGVVCRAPYRFVGSDVETVDLAQGLFLCIPDSAVSPAPETFNFAGSEVPICRDSVLRQYKFIEN